MYASAGGPASRSLVVEACLALIVLKDQASPPPDRHWTALKLLLTSRHAESIIWEALAEHCGVEIELGTQVRSGHQCRSHLVGVS
jgi:hypothetical protein